MSLQLQVIGGISFQQLNPAASPDRYYVRHAGAGPVTIEAQYSGHAPQWTSEQIEGPAGSATTATAQHQRFIIPRPLEACAIRITCRSGNDVRQVEIWYVACSLVATRAESPGADNPNWPDVLSYLRHRYVGGQVHDFPRLGLFQFRYSSPDDAGIRYGDFIKLVATITPHNTPLTFFHARRVVSASVNGVAANGQALNWQRGPGVHPPLPGMNDTSLIPSGVLTPAGKLFDYDLPGGTMRSFNEAGDRHTWNITFEQAIGVGATTRGNAWDALASHARQLASTRWSVNYGVRYNSPAGTSYGEVVVT